MDKSFYGGSQGKSFTIRKIFNSKKDMIENDLNMRWQSPINVGDIVIISYGLPNSSSYETNKQADLDKFEGKTYNSTLWQKIYTESPSDQKDELTGIEVEWAIENYGLGYKLLASMTGNTPKINAIIGTSVSAGDDPSIEFNADDIDNPILTLHLPRSQNIKVLGIEEIGPGEKPSRIYDDTGSKINEPELTFYLPRAVKFYYGTELGTKTATVLPNPGDYKIGDYYINKGTGFVYEITDAPEGSDCTVEFVACLIAPAPTTEYEVLNPYELDTSTGEYVISEPTIESGYTDPINEIGWKFKFGLPQIPNIELNQTESSFEFCGADEEGSGSFSGEPVSESTFEITYNLTVPRGSRIFTGAEISGAANSTVIISGAKPGDLYLNNDNGDVYILDITGVWNYQLNLTGEIGHPIGIGSETIQIGPAQVASPSDSTIGAYLNTIEPFATTKPSEYEIIPVNYTDASGVITSYYFSYKNDTWSSVVITGNAVAFVNNTYDETKNDDNKAYSITVVNQLVKELRDINGWFDFSEITESGNSNLEIRR